MTDDIIMIEDSDPLSRVISSIIIINQITSLKLDERIKRINK
jgi:hypothetical protein